MTSFAELKRNRGQAGIEKLSQDLEGATAKKTNYKDADERFWQPTVDKAGNGTAVIRFLPTPKGDDLPWAKFFSHSFQGPTGAWYIENSLTTLNQKDPVSEYNTELWKSGIEANKTIASKQARKANFVANILVISDTEKPENEGKVFLYKFGQRIFDKLNEASHPDNEGLKSSDADFKAPFNPFDLWEGANLRLRIRKEKGYRNYDKSEFLKPSPALDGPDSVLEELWNQELSLKEFTDPKNFKAYDALKDRFEKVVGLNGKSAPAPKSKTIVETKLEQEDLAVNLASDDDDDSEDLSFLKNITD